MEVELKNIKYESNNETLLEDINIKFKEKEINSIIGPSGCGKSLIGYIICKLINPTQGYVMVDGKRNYDINTLRKNIGYVFQNPKEVFTEKTVYEELSSILKEFNYKLEEESKRIKNSLKMLNLDEDILNKDPYTLSSGEQESLAIAISLLLNPKVLILDEPTIYLDNKNINNLIKLLKKLKRDYNKTIIIISNDIEFVHQISDRIILLNNGKKILDIDNKSLIDNYNILKDNNMEIPPIINFINKTKEIKNIELIKTNDINELIKDIYNNVRK